VSAGPSRSCRDPWGPRTRPRGGQDGEIGTWVRAAAERSHRSWRRTPSPIDGSRSPSVGDLRLKRNGRPLHADPVVGMRLPRPNASRDRAGPTGVCARQLSLHCGVTRAGRSATRTCSHRERTRLYQRAEGHRCGCSLIPAPPRVLRRPLPAAHPRSRPPPRAAPPASRARPGCLARLPQAYRCFPR